MRKMKSDVPIFFGVFHDSFHILDHHDGRTGRILAGVLSPVADSGQHPAPEDLRKIKEMPLWAGILLILAGLALFIGSAELARRIKH